MKSDLTIVIPTYNGLSLLKEHLPKVVKYGEGCQIIIVDDASTDDTISWLKQHYPQIKIQVNNKNLGFAKSVNLGFKLSQTKFVLLLNNDVDLTATTIDKLKHHFHDLQVFAVGAKEILPDKSFRGKSRGFINRGLVMHSKAHALTNGPTFWVFGASGMFNRDIWLELGGFDTNFYPAYWEDIDISYRAWKAGYSCLFEFNAEVFHHAESTMNQSLGRKKTAIAFKNQLLFFWLNITDKKLWLQHLIWLPYHLLVTNIKTNFAFQAGFNQAIRQAINLSSRTNLQVKRTDQQILSIFK